MILLLFTYLGSTNLTMYIVKAPLMGYMTANSAKACIIR